jgi:PAS domain S-box-containing protein
MTSRLHPPQRIALLVWLAGLTLSALLAWWVHSTNERLYAKRLAALGDEVAEQVTQRFGLYAYGLRGARGAVVAAGGAAVTRDVFAAYMDTRDLASEFPGALGFGFIRRVLRADEARFLASAREEGPASFAIREMTPHDADRFVIQYIYPLDQNQGATGLDVASEVNRREAALAAAREGRARITAPITLVQADAQPRRGFLVYLPVYRAGAPVHTPEAREAATIGWAYAPLVVDSVLAGLGTRAQQVAIRLTDAAEKEAFFDSTPTGAYPLADVPEAVREITIHGRAWRLQVRALPGLAEDARPTSAAGTAASAVAGSTLLALLVRLLLTRRREGGAGGRHLNAAPVTLKRFLSSPQLRWALLAYLPFMAAFVWVGHEAEWSRQLGEARTVLVKTVDDRAASAREVQQARRKTQVFLADVPAVQGLVRTLPTGVDPQDGSLRGTWESDMRQVLAAHLRASPEVYRVRLIAVAEGGSELVRVERRGHDVVAVPAAELQTLGEHPDLKRALTLQAGEVWISGVDLNREQGRLELPHRPTLRYATPIHHADGQVFGAIMEHIDVAARLADAPALQPLGGTLYILNASGDFLLHPMDARRHATDLGHNHRWDDEFQPASGSIEFADDDRLQVLRGEQGLVLAATSMVSPNPATTAGTVRYVATLPLARVEAAVWSAMGRTLLLPLATGVAGSLLLFFYWASVQRQLQARSQRLRLATIVDQSVDAIVGLDAAQRVTSWNRSAERLFGIEEKQAVGKGLLELIGAASGAALLFDVGEDHGGWRAKEFDCRGRDGRPLRVAMSWSRLVGGQAGDSSAVLRDVTDEHAAQRRIAELNRGLEQRVQERTEMLDVLAHEVRQPLQNAAAAMEGARGALEGDGCDGSSAPLLRAQAVLAEVQSSLDNTLAVASLLARPDPIHLDDADIDTLIGVAIADMPSGERGRIQVKRETATRTVLMDVSLMRLALRNLLSNALKFSPPGSAVRVRIVDSDAPLGLLIEVSDRGPGVSPELRPRLFKRGARGGGPRSSHGLGLYIVQQVMALHQGSIELIDTGPDGSTFRLTIVQGEPDH